MEPSYETKYFPDEAKRGNLVKFVSGKKDDSNSSIFIHQDIEVFATLLDKDASVEHKMEEGRKAYIHVIQTGGSVLLNDSVALEEGDGAFVEHVDRLKITGSGDGTAEVLLFDLCE